MNRIKTNALCELLSSAKTNSCVGAVQVVFPKGSKVLVHHIYAGTCSCCLFEENKPLYHSHDVHKRALKFIRMVPEEERGTSINSFIRELACKSKIRRFLKQGPVSARFGNEIKTFMRPLQIEKPFGNWRSDSYDNCDYQSIGLAEDFELLTCDDEDVRKRAKDEEAFFVSKIEQRFKSRVKNAQQNITWSLAFLNGFTSTHGLLPSEFTSNNKELTKKLKEDFTALVKKRDWASEVQKLESTWKEIQQSLEQLVGEFTDHFLETIRKSK